MYVPLTLLILCVVHKLHSHTYAADKITHRDSMAISLIMSTVSYVIQFWKLYHLGITIKSKETSS